MKNLQELNEEPNNFQRRINQMVHLHQEREQAYEKIAKHQAKVKRLFDKHAKDKIFLPSDMVLKWDKRKEEPRRHENSDNLWLGPFIIDRVEDESTFSLRNFEGEEVGPTINDQFLKHYLTY